MDLAQIPAAGALLPAPKLKAYAPAIKQFNAWLDGRPITEETVRQFFAGRRGQYSTRSVALHKVAIKRALLALYPSHDSRVRASFDALFREIKLPKPEVRVHDSQVFSKAEFKKLVAKAPKPLGVLVRILYNTGARVSEGLSIKLSECREDRGVMLCRIVGKGGKEGILSIEKKLFDQARKLYRGRVWLFENQKTGKPYTRKHAGIEMSRLSKRVLGRNMHPHTTRHSRITHLLEAGQPLDAVSRFARHAQTSTTLAFYAHTRISSRTLILTGL